MKEFRLRTIFVFLRSLISYFLGSIVLLLFIPPLMLMVSLPASWRYESRFTYRVADLLYRGIVCALLMPKRVVGKENMPQQPAIIIANHQSSFDIPILGSVLNGYPHIWLALIDFINTPVLGYLIKKMGVWVDRRNSISGARTVLQGIRHANEKKAHIVLFPEGGRYIDGSVHEFLGGFGVIARKTGRKVIPVYMPYNKFIFPPGNFLIGYHKILIIIGPAFSIEEGETDKEFIARVHEWFDNKVKEVEQ